MHVITKSTKRLQIVIFQFVINMLVRNPKSMEALKINTLSEEIKSSDVFVQAIEAGMSVKNAYYAAHHEDIMANVAGAVAQTTAAKAAEHYAAVSRRPREGAAGAAPGAISKKNVNDLTEKDIMSILKRVEKGEKITF